MNQGYNMSQAPQTDVHSSSQATVLTQGGTDKRLVFSSLAWMKLSFMLHAGPTEVSGFGITKPSDPLYVEDFQIVKQYGNPAFTRMDEIAISDLIQDFACHPDESKRRQPENVSRIWIHTHPGNSPNPSSTDEDTLRTTFGGYAWAVMFIIARGGQTYCRLRFNQGPGVSMIIPVYIDHDSLPKMLNEDAQAVADQIVSWPTLYRTCVHTNRGDIYVSRENEWAGTRRESKNLPNDYFDTHGNRSRFSQGAANPGLTPPSNLLPDETLEDLVLDLPTLDDQNAHAEAQIATDPSLATTETPTEAGGGTTTEDTPSSSTTPPPTDGSEPIETGNASETASSSDAPAPEASTSVEESSPEPSETAPVSSQTELPLESNDAPSDPPAAETASTNAPPAEQSTSTSDDLQAYIAQRMQEDGFASDVEAAAAGRLDEYMSDFAEMQKSEAAPVEIVDPAFVESLRANGQLVELLEGEEIPADLPANVTHVQYPDGSLKRVGFAGSA